MKSFFGEICNCNDQYLSIRKMKIFEELLLETNVKFTNLIHCRVSMWKKFPPKRKICGQR